MTRQKVYLDMDGTIADLYHEVDWLKKLQREENSLFSSLKPMISEKDLLELFPANLYDIRILSMTPKGATDKYCQQVVKEKNEWLNKYFPAIQKRIYLRYGLNKNLKACENALLIDDNESIRKSFRGTAVPPMWL